MNDTLAGASPVDQPVRPRRVDVVPSVMHCARCKFRLQRVNLYVHVGTVGAGDNDTEPCPNGCGPLWPVTWEQEAREGYKLAEDLFERAKRAEDALCELVALKDLKGRIKSADLCTYGVADAEAAQALADEYQQRKPKASFRNKPTRRT